MIALTLCVVAFLVCLVSARHSVASGVISLLAVGYAYGILRANLLTTASHFVFDAALVGVYAGAISWRTTQRQARSEQHLREWVIALAIIPTLLVLLPFQDPLVELVGYRGAVMFLPTLIIGARLDAKTLSKLGVGVAFLNIAAFIVAAAEFFISLELFFPRSPVTEIIYRSQVVYQGMGGFQSVSYRIPATFSSSAAYAGTMIGTLPFLVIAVTGKWSSTWQKLVCASGMAVAVVAVFMAASRTATLLLGVVVIATVFELRSRKWFQIGLFAGLAVLAVVVAAEPRLQRFYTLSNQEYVSSRISGSVNLSILDLITRYPWGNGLGAGGTSLPYFLQDRVVHPILVENEWARIALEQGILGLALWIGFFAWLLIATKARPGSLIVKVCYAAILVTGFTGTGMLTAIPGTVILFLLAGWLTRDDEDQLPKSARINSPNGYLVNTSRLPKAGALTDWIGASDTGSRL